MIISKPSAEVSEKPSVKVGLLLKNNYSSIVTLLSRTENYDCNHIESQRNKRFLIAFHRKDGDKVEGLLLFYK